MKGFLLYSRECVDENRFRVKLLLTLEHDLPINFFGIYLGKNDSSIFCINLELT